MKKRRAPFFLLSLFSLSAQFVRRVFFLRWHQINAYLNYTLNIIDTQFAYTVGEKVWNSDFSGQKQRMEKDEFFSSLIIIFYEAAVLSKGFYFTLNIKSMPT